MRHAPFVLSYYEGLKESMELEKRMINTFNVKRILILLLFIAVLPLDTSTGYYYFLRFAVFVGSIYLIVKDKDYQKIPYIVMLILWNPIIIISFDGFLWKIFDILAALFLIKKRLSEEERGSFFKF